MNLNVGDNLHFSLEFVRYKIQLILRWGMGILAHSNGLWNFPWKYGMGYDFS